MGRDLSAPDAFPGEPACDLLGSSPQEALRLLDRYWRTKTEQRVELASLYGHLLGHQCGNWPMAVRVFEYAIGQFPSAEIEANLIFGLLQTGRLRDARDRMLGALRCYAVRPESDLAARAWEIAEMSGGAVRGWAGMAPDGRIWAEAAVTETAVARFELRTVEGSLVSSSEKVVLPNERIRVYFRSALLRNEGLRLTVNGYNLFGGQELGRPDFRVDGRSRICRNIIDGWARIGWNPDMPVRLVVRDGTGHIHRLEARDRLPGSRWQFRFDVRKTGLKGGRFEVLVRLPRGVLQPLPDSPLLTDAEAKRGLFGIGRPGKTPRAHGRRPIAVVIPVYEDREKTLRCIESVRRTCTRTAAAIVVVDDATPDPLLASALTSLGRQDAITLLRNPKNLGFSASVNRAIALCPDHDIVLLNSDVVVFDGWLERLRNVAYGTPRVGTVTPFANDDSIAGYANGSREAAETLNEYAASLNAGSGVPIPVGVGFCLFIRRACLDEIGAFDAAVFGKGYGEESDFCMRARGRGWKHMLAADVVVHHDAGSSFGPLRPALRDRAWKLMNIRHPTYERLLTRFAARDPLHPWRRRLDERRLLALGGRVVLVATLALSGGVERVVRERCRQLRAEGRVPLILRPRRRGPDECQLWCPELLARDLHYCVPGELHQLDCLLKSLKLESVEIHHFLGLDPALIAVLQQLGAPVDIYVHDYSWICPRITLTDGSARYCGEPSVSACERCIERNGSALFERVSVRNLRRRSARWLGSARQVVVPSRDTAVRLQRYMPGIAFQVSPNEVFVSRLTRPTWRPRPSTRVAVLGAVTYHKGYKILKECGKDAARRGLNLDFVLIGYSINDAALMGTGKIFVTGPYADQEVVELFARERPDAVFLPSVWPETWCFTLTHALRTGLPIVAFDLGAVAERLREAGEGTLVPLGMSPRMINECLMRVASESGSSRSSASTFLESAV